jgi:hypothetical protein
MIEMQEKNTARSFGGWEKAHREFIEAKGKGRARAIKLKCAECVNFEDVVNRVRECGVLSCALHTIRPFQEKT